MTFNIEPTAHSDGIAYATSVPLTSTEATLGDALATPALIATTYGEAIVATVKLTASGLLIGNSTYVVLQMDMGDGLWVDMCWCFWNGTQGTATFVMSNGIAGANVFQQSRASGAVPTPQASGSNQLTLGGRLRFVGKTVMTGGSSIALGSTAGVVATIRYKLLGLR
jgi:hypothetical protein